MNLRLRHAEIDDIPTLQQLIARSARELARPYYTHEQIEAALGSAWGVDTRLIRDRTYFVAEVDASIAACGGWSRRKALFGADAVTAREPELLDPARDAARIRAFFVDPLHARRGLARALLVKCESEARLGSFRAAELVATLSGQAFYQRYGYVALAPMEFPLRDGLSITFVPMRKAAL